MFELFPFFIFCHFFCRQTNTTLWMPCNYSLSESECHYPHITTIITSLLAFAIVRWHVVYTSSFLSTLQPPRYALNKQLTATHSLLILHEIIHTICHGHIDMMMICEIGDNWLIQTHYMHLENVWGTRAVLEPYLLLGVFDLQVMPGLFLKMDVNVLKQINSAVAVRLSPADL